MSHLTGDVKRLMGLVTKYDQDNYPEMLGHICIVNAPGIFRMLWNVVKGMIDPRTQSKIEASWEAGPWGQDGGVHSVERACFTSTIGHLCRPALCCHRLC